MGLLGIIPARGGSKGVKNKNIRVLGGKPLIQYTIEAALASGCVDRLVVTSDDDKILEIAKSLEVDCIKRPDELASDTASSDAVIFHVLETLTDLSDLDDLVLLQPTSPLRTANDISLAYAKYKEVHPEMLISVSRVEMELQKAFVSDSNGYLRGLLSPDAPFTRRQDLPDIFLPNGAIYICGVGRFKSGKALPRVGLFPYVMGADVSVDIDTVADFERAEKFLKK